MWELFLSLNNGDPQLVCGHDDPFELIEKAQDLIDAFDDLTPNVRCVIRTSDGRHKASIDSNGVDF